MVLKSAEFVIPKDPVQKGKAKTATAKMANVMLTSETAKDPNKPFKLRVEDVCTKFDVRASFCASADGSGD